MPIVFKEELILKKDIYNRMIELFKDAGWSDVSSKPSSDFNVLKSTGEDGDKELCFQIRATDINNRNDVRETAYTNFSIRLIEKYVPRGFDQSGIIERSNEPWHNIRFYRSNSNLNDHFLFYHHVDKDKGIFVFKKKFESSSTATSELFYIGLPKSFITENKSSGVISFATYGQVGSYYSDRYNNRIRITNHPTSPSRNSYFMTPIYRIFSGTSSEINKIYLNKINYEDNVSGVRGEIEGIYAIPNSQFVDGDIVKAGNKKYKLFKNNNTYYSSLHHAVGFAIRIE